MFSRFEWNFVVWLHFLEGKGISQWSLPACSQDHRPSWGDDLKWRPCLPLQCIIQLTRAHCWAGFSLRCSKLRQHKFALDQYKIFLLKGISAKQCKEMWRVRSYDFFFPIAVLDLCMVVPKSNGWTSELLCLYCHFCAIPFLFWGVFWSTTQRSEHAYSAEVLFVAFCCCEVS